MPADPKNIDLLLQFALLVAGEEDELFDRQLGPIHLIKYVYLGDLAFAQRHSGQTFTGANWQFYKFGPWSQTINERIHPALSAIGANCTTFKSDFEDKDDWSRWSLRQADLLSDLEKQLPPEIRLALEPQIHRYGKDTPNLLDHVYKTAPMLAAAPLEFLDFSAVVLETRASQQHSENSPESISEKRKKRFREHMQQIRQTSQDRLTKKRVLINPVKHPPAEAVLVEGLAWLEELAGDDIPEGTKVVEFSESVWKSSTRKGHDVS